ncbi:hypothetical protein IAT38_004488 [Cryptococcus sp. DSM 104549]
MDRIVEFFGASPPYPPYYFTEFKSGNGTVACWFLRFIVLKTTWDWEHNDRYAPQLDNLDRTLGSMSKYFDELDSAMNTLWRWEVAHFLPNAWGQPVAGEAEPTPGHEIPSDPQDTDPSLQVLPATFIESAFLALKRHEEGYDPLWFEMWDLISGGEEYSVFRFPPGFPVSNDEIMPRMPDVEVAPDVNI